jgi:hypothetical protein
MLHHQKAVTDPPNCTQQLGGRDRRGLRGARRAGLQGGLTGRESAETEVSDAHGLVSQLFILAMSSW